MLKKFYMKLVTNVLSVDMLAKFQKPFMKPYYFTTRGHRIATKSSLDLLDYLGFFMYHVNRTLPLKEIYSN